MASRNFYIQLIFRVLVLTMAAVGMSWAWMQEWYIVAVALLITLIILTWSLIRYINRTNRKIAYFFDAIKNEDFTLHFPEDVSIKSFKELNHSLNRVNDLIREVHTQLQTREQYYLRILKQADIGIMTYNEKGHILFSNPTLERLLNHKPLNHIRQLAMVDEGLCELFTTPGTFDNKIYSLSNERENIQLVIKSTAMALDSEQVWVVTLQDIQRQLDEKETDSYTRLIRVLTHEILNTITPITSLSESILSYYTTDTNEDAEQEKRRQESTVKGLEVIRDQGQDLTNFVQSYRSLLNLPQPEKSLIQIQKLFDKLTVMMNEQSKMENATIETFVEPPDMELYTDERQIIQVLVNLVKNALHALEEKTEGRILVKAIKNNVGNTIISVEDNGPGIPPDILDEIFVPFFTTKKSGTGIGLSLSRQIVQLNGGRLLAESKPGEWTRFLMEF